VAVRHGNALQPIVGAVQSQVPVACRNLLHQINIGP
jgi:hypothetical protein